MPLNVSLQLSPEDNSDQLHPQAHRQTKIQAEQDGTQARPHPHHLQGDKMK